MIIKAWAHSVDGGLGYNEEAYYFDEEKGIYLLSHGMGGATHGSSASQQACFFVSDFLESIQNSSEYTWPYEMLPELSREQNLMRVAFLLANEKIYEENLEKYSKPMRASQMLAVYQSGARVSFLNLGLNRVYIYRDGSLQRVIHETSLAQWKHIVPVKRDNNIALGALGLDEAIINMDFYETTLKTGDMILTMSAGVYLLLDDEKLQKIISRTSDQLQRIPQEILSFVQNQSPKINATLMALSAQEENFEEIFS